MGEGVVKGVKEQRKQRLEENKQRIEERKQRLEERKQKLEESKPVDCTLHYGNKDETKINTNNKDNVLVTSDVGKKVTLDRNHWRDILNGITSFFYDENQMVGKNNQKDGSTTFKERSKDILSFVMSKETAFIWAFLMGIIVYYEVVFYLLKLSETQEMIIYPILFAIMMGTILSGIVHLFHGKGKKIILWVITGLNCILFSIHLIYYHVFKVLFSFQMAGMAGDAFSEFGGDIATAVKQNVGGLMLFLVPLLVLWICMPYMINSKGDKVSEDVVSIQENISKQNGYSHINQKQNRREGFVIVIGIFATYLISILSLNVYGKEDYTPYDLYYNSRIHDLCGKQLGIITMTRFDIAQLASGKEDSLVVDGDSIVMGINLDDMDQGSNLNSGKDTTTNIAGSEQSSSSNPGGKTTDSSNKDKSENNNVDQGTVGHQDKNNSSSNGGELAGTENGSNQGTTVAEVVITPEPIVTPEPIDTSPNVLKIDFEQLIQNEDDKNIRVLHEYFKDATPTKKNEYTGMFEGYNLILITAEGFSPYAVHPTKTPTLHRLVGEGFAFTNFYTPLWQTSTSDGEYIVQTGLIPVGTKSMYRSRDNALPFVLGNQFRNIGIYSRAYHNHTYTYYERDETHPNLGYDYKGVGNGLELEHIVWPNSDLEMIQSTTKDFVQDEPFFVYYLTVSGHMNYTFMGNTMSSKNKELVADLPYSSDVKAYIACQMELDKALEQLIKDLEEAGVADNTVIALSADHHPYGWEKEYIDEIAGYEVDPNFDIYRNHLILWTPSMEEKIVIDKPCSSLDILPTLSNLFGLSYDSRLLMGQDILSDINPLVILSNRSFITDKVKYNAATRETTLLTEEPLSENYMETVHQLVKNKFIVSEAIVDHNYYKYIMPSIGRE